MHLTFLHISRSKFARICVAMAMAVVIAVSAWSAMAQRPGDIASGMIGNEEIQGTVFFPPGDRSGIRPTIKVQSLSSPEITGVTDQDGIFRVTHLRPDTYTVIIDAGETYEKVTETVSIGFSGSVPAQGNVFSYAIPAVYQLQVYLKPKHPGDTASISPSSKKLLERALKEQKAGDHPAAIKDLNALVLQEPTFVPAYRELCSEYLKTGQGNLAVASLEKALNIAPDDPALLLNYGVALLNQKRFDDAERQLRLSISKSQEYSVAAHYYLGLALLTEHKIGDAQVVFEEVSKKSSSELPLVHRYLGGIYLHDGLYEKAADELETYLKLDAKADDAMRIRETIKRSRQKNWSKRFAK